MKVTKKLKKYLLNKKSVQKFPETPGIYIFWNKKGRINYIGKAINIKKRVTSYFALTLQEKTRNMMRESKYISYLKVGSELEALVLEARLISQDRPKYNSDLKDDKHPLYIRVTKGKYPRVLTARKIESGKPNRAFFGPFPSAYKVRSVLRMLRKVFPFSEHKIGKRRCMYSHMGLCNPCPNEIDNLQDLETQKKLRKQYLANIRRLQSTLTGKIMTVRRDLKKEMLGLAKQERFEKAAQIREKIEWIDYITQPITPISSFLKNPNLIEDIRLQEVKDLRNIVGGYLKIPRKLRRIECFDVAHLAGSKPTASMVTFINGETDNSLYRHFRIRQRKTRSDTDSLAEVARRRIGHLTDWGVPDLVVVDGGKGQVSAFVKVFEEYDVAVVGIAKRSETLVIPDKNNGRFKTIRLTKGPALNLVQRLRDEAHRFARRYHHKLLQKSLLPTK